MNDWDARGMKRVRRWVGQWGWRWMGRRVLLMVAIALALAIATLSPPAQAHGVSITYQETPAIALEALFDNGEPMAGAQVAVFSPADPQTPWLRGVADEAGRFTFSPDPTQPGNWEVQVRQAGHGEILVIPVGSDAAAGSRMPRRSASSLTPLQKGVMLGSVVWGCVGTALFFSRRSKAHNAHT